MSSLVRSRSYVLTLMCLFLYPATPVINSLSLHDALPISMHPAADCCRASRTPGPATNRTPSRVRRKFPEASGDRRSRSEEHTSELQSPCNLVCRLLLEKKNRKIYKHE